MVVWLSFWRAWPFLVMDCNKEVLDVDVKVKIMAIAGIVALEGAGIYFGVNGDTLVYAIGALAGLGGVETLEAIKRAKSA